MATYDACVKKWTTLCPAVARSLEDAALTLLFGLVAFGHIQLRRIDGHQHLPSFLANMRQQVA